MTEEFCRQIFPPSQAGCGVILHVVYNQIDSIDWFFRPRGYQTRMEDYPYNTLFDCMIHYIYWINPSLHDSNIGNKELCQQHSIWDATLLTPLSNYLMQTGKKEIMNNKMGKGRTYTSLMKSEYLSTALRIHEYAELTMNGEEVGIALHRVLWSQKAIRELALNWLLLYCHWKPVVPDEIKAIVSAFKRFDYNGLKGSADEDKQSVLETWPIQLLEQYGIWEYGHREPDFCVAEEWKKENLLPFTIIIKKLDFAVLEEPVIVG